MAVGRREPVQEPENTENTPGSPASTSDRLRALNTRNGRIALVVAIAVLGGLLGYFLTRGGGSGSAASTITSGQQLPGIPSGTQVGPIPLTTDGVSNTAGAIHQAVYWLGPKKGYTYQFERTADNNVFLAYLPPGVAATSNRNRYVVIGSYPFKNPVGALRTVGQKAGNEIIDLPNGGIAVPGDAHPNSVWVAYPGIDTEIEVYSPKAGEARKLALSKDLQPVG